MAKTKEKANEVKGVVATLLQLATITIPFGTAFQIGIPKLTTDEMSALALVVVSVAIGYFWLRRNSTK